MRSAGSSAPSLTPALVPAPAPALALVMVFAPIGCGDDGGAETGASASSSGSGASGASGPSGTASSGEGSSGSEGSSGGSGSEGSTSAGSSDGSAGTSTSTGGETSGSSGEATSTGGALDECPRVRVVVQPGNVLNVRPDPSTKGAPVGSLANGAIVDVLSIVHGEAIDGVDLWYEVDDGQVSGFVFGAFVECTLEEPPELLPPDGYYLPLECGMSAKIAQGNFGDFSHQGKAKYAFDFSIGLNTPLTAMADGVVIHVYDQTGPGDPCYSGGGQECFPYANLVVLLHGDGAASIYKHLNKVHVGLGEFVPRGATIGLSGSTGYSTGRHAHVMREEDCGVANCQSIPLSFVDVPGDGVPVTGQTVTSMNCP